METYLFLRELLGSYALVGMMLVYLAAICWAFRPGSRQVHDDISRIPLRNDTLGGPYKPGEAE